MEEDNFGRRRKNRGFYIWEERPGFWSVQAREARRSDGSRLITKYHRRKLCQPFVESWDRAAVSPPKPYSREIVAWIRD